jgi:hypothetical protein
MVSLGQGVLWLRLWCNGNEEQQLDVLLGGCSGLSVEWFGLVCWRTRLHSWFDRPLLFYVTAVQAGGTAAQSFWHTVPHMMHAAALLPLAAFAHAQLPPGQVMVASAGTAGRAVGRGNPHP